MDDKIIKAGDTFNQSDSQQSRNVPITINYILSKTGIKILSDEDLMKCEFITETYCLLDDFLIKRLSKLSVDGWGIKSIYVFYAENTTEIVLYKIISMIKQ